MAEQRFSADFFEPLIGRTFDIAFPDGTIHLTLRSVTRLRAPYRLDEKGEEIEVNGDARKDPFTLLFGGASHLMPQRTYHLRSEAAPEPIEMFIVPIGEDREGFMYQAIFG
jgi:hypothetical protein